MSLPACVTYQSRKPAGFTTQYKKLIINPQMSFNQLKTNEYVRFQLNTDGFLDPYSVYFEFEIEVPFGDPVAAVLDGHSTSLISELIINQNSTQQEIERITEYDQIGQILYDLNQFPTTDRYQTYLGTRGNIAPYFNQNGQVYQTQIADVVGTSTSFYRYWYRPTFSTQNSGYVVDPSITEIYNSRLHAESFQKDNTNNPESNWRYYLRGQSQIGVQAPKSIAEGKQYPGTKTSITNGNCDTYGYRFWADQALNAEDSAWLDWSSHRCLLKQGRIINQTGDTASEGNIYRQKFIVPLLSGVIGHLIPQQAWKLIPAKALAQLIIEIRLNPYAFFMNGQYYDNGSASWKTPTRTWKVKDIHMVADLWFYDSIVTQQIDQALSGEGIVMTSQNFTMGPSYTVANTNQLQNSWIIPGGVESANALFIWILDNGYLRYPFFRKHFRLSGNITYLQLKIGADYIPPLPLTGHAGNPVLVDDEKDDNTQFVMELHKTAGALFDTSRTTRINNENFAPNKRFWDPSTNSDEQKYDLPMAHEMRYKGRALYAIRMDNNPFENNVISGLDTKTKSPIELVIKVQNDHPNAVNNNDQTLYMCYWHDFIVNYKTGSVTTYGQK